MKSRITPQQMGAKKKIRAQQGRFKLTKVKSRIIVRQSRVRTPG